ncbi:hypothetical protein [Chelativorans intermedius]|uniref:Uncharacterized protein n=1 Tax=Chelativorans intermedius TaxID=515947 RepID=A0ABV6DC34_9HYPH|nr:hypothetical protein [Chelativorans intermedius]MCT9000337.1 hypothetical protein [Chelativorans intermedius]
MNRISKTIAIAAGLAGVAAAPIAFAQDDAETRPPDQSPGMQEMMQGGGMGMMPMMGMMSQMNEMMSTCNKMMQAMMQDMPSEESEKPDNKG